MKLQPSVEKGKKHLDVDDWELIHQVKIDILGDSLCFFYMLN